MRYGALLFLTSALAFGFEDYGCVISYEDEPMQAVHQAREQIAHTISHEQTHPTRISRPVANQSIEEQVADLRERIDAMTKENALLKESVNLTSGNPYLEDKTWYLNGDVIYWHANIDQTEYGDRRSPGSDGVTVNFAPARIDYDWDFGFKIGVGRYLNHDDWDLFVSTTYYRTSGSGQINSGTDVNVNIIPWNGTGTVGGEETPNFGKSNVEFKYNDLIAEIGRSYFTSGKLSLRPHWGLKGLWANLNQFSRFTGGALGGGTKYIKELTKMRGFGPRTGLNSTWYLFDRVNIVGNLAFSFIYNNFKTQMIEEDPSPNIIDLQESLHAFIPNADLFFGIGVGDYFSKKKYYLEGKLGYEMQYFWNMRRYSYPYTAGANSLPLFTNAIGNASLSGFTLNLSVDF